MIFSEWLFTERHGPQAQWADAEAGAAERHIVVDRHVLQSWTMMFTGANPLQLSNFGCTLPPFAQVSIMYAIIQTSGRQVRVTPGGFSTIDGTAGEPGAKLTLETVLLVETDAGEVIAGAPFVANARVLAVVDGETRGPKIRVFKKKRRKGMRRTKGHRATYTRVRITDILL